MELLLTSGLLTEGQAMLRAAERRAAQVHRRAMARGGYGLTLNAATNVQHASFSRGISGIGYELLPAVLTGTAAQRSPAGLTCLAQRRQAHCFDSLGGQSPGDKSSR